MALCNSSGCEMPRCLPRTESRIALHNGIYAGRSLGSYLHTISGRMIDGVINASRDVGRVTLS